MKKMINTERIVGYVFEHSLEVKMVKNETSPNYGKEYIGGELRIATDENLLNVIPVNFSYVTPTTKSGSENATYKILKRIIDEGKSVVEVGKENALKVRVNTALGLNEFINQNDEIISTKINEGGFVSIVNDLGDENERNIWTADTIITNARVIEADPEKNIDNDYMIIKGVVFNFRNQILPVEFKLEVPEGIAFFEDREPSSSNPVFTKLTGKIMCNTLKTQIKEETAFGEAIVRTSERKVKEWVILNSANPYEFDEEETITVAELQKAIEDRNITIAELKKRHEEFKANKNVTSPVTKQASIQSATFEF